MTMTNKESALRANEKRRKAGLVPVLCWVPEEDKHAIKRFATGLRNGLTSKGYTDKHIERK